MENMKKSVILIMGALLIILALLFKSGEVFFITSVFVITGLASLDVPIFYQYPFKIFFKLVSMSIILLLLQVLAFLGDITGKSENISEIVPVIYLGPNLLIKLFQLIDLKISFSLSIGFIGNLLLFIVTYLIYFVIKKIHKQYHFIKKVKNETN